MTYVDSGAMAEVGMFNVCVSCYCNTKRRTRDEMYPPSHFVAVGVAEAESAYSVAVEKGPKSTFSVTTGRFRLEGFILDGSFQFAANRCDGKTSLLGNTTHYCIF